MSDIDPGTAIESTKAQEARRRRTVVSAMLRSGYTDDEIFEIVSQKTLKSGATGLGLSRSEMRAEMHKAYAQWATEDSERAPYDKSAAVRRLHRHIRDASASGKFTAVANMEKVLGMIQGTVEAPGGGVQVVQTPSRWAEAVMQKITKLQPDEFRALVEEQRRLNEHLPAEPVNVTEEATVIDIPPSE